MRVPKGLKQVCVGLGVFPLRESLFTRFATASRREGKIMNDQWFEIAITLYASANEGWRRAEITQTERHDRIVSRRQQALQDHLDLEGWHWERFETALKNGLLQVENSRPTTSQALQVEGLLQFEHST